ncbi:CBO0543 family protein [Neobacillus niacini]|uniref:CBO0543 family protein n=1 Tax=Neobacillus niacini TaxID=86668 RepID=UPI0005EDF32E|nr:CBO0543 family protein [Neobacillus niacini]
MSDAQKEALNKLIKEQQKGASQWLNYWQEFSAFDTWQFWFHVIMFVAPLIILYFALDWKRALRLGFYGFNVHVWFTYFDDFGTTQALWTYPYKMIPFIPHSVGMDASLVPVMFILVYQWTIKHNKNYYLYTLLLSLFLSFILKPIFVMHHLFKFNSWVNYFHLFLTYIVIIVLSKVITDFFLHFQKIAQDKAIEAKTTKRNPRKR